MGLKIKKLDTNKWFLNIRVRKNGHEYRKRITFHGTKPKAEEKYIEVKKQLRSEGANWGYSLKTTTFGELLSMYKEKRNGIPTGDKSRYNALKKDLGNLPIIGFAVPFEQYLKLIKTIPSNKTKKPLSGATINRYMAMVKAAFSLAVNLELIDKNPITKARFPLFKEVPRDRVLSDNEINRLMDIIQREAPHIEAIVTYALQVPCRKAELLNMKREHLDLVNNAIWVPNGTTKNGEGIWKPIPPDMVSYFRNLPKESEYLFFRKVKGRYLPQGDFRRAFNRALLLAKIEGYVFHSTRHQSATALIDNGSPERAVRQIAGWKSDMLRLYYHKNAKKSLQLIKFNTGSGRKVDTLESDGPVIADETGT